MKPADKSATDARGGNEWDRLVKKPEELCEVCEKAIAPKAEILSLLVRTDEGFERRDLHATCAPPEHLEVFSYWRWRRDHEPLGGPRRLDLAFLTDFFKRLDREKDATSARVRWIVALLLLRRRILELTGREADAEGREVLKLRLKREERDFEVTDPGLDATSMADIEQDLGRVFNLGPAADKGKRGPSKGEAGAEGAGAHSEAPRDSDADASDATPKEG